MPQGNGGFEEVNSVPPIGVRPFPRNSWCQGEVWDGPG